jgi:hypothetical protein
MAQNGSTSDDAHSSPQGRPSSSSPVPRPLAGRIVPPAALATGEAADGPAAVTDRRLVGRAILLSILFPAVAWFFGGWLGLIVGATAVAGWWLFALPRFVFWLASVICMSLVPVATWAQGLPQTPVVGSDFGTNHWVAHRLVIASLVLAAFAGLTELLGLRMGRSRARPGRFDRWRRGVAARLRSDQDNRGDSGTDGELDHPPGGLLPTT